MTNAPQNPSHLDLYVAMNGNDNWSGRLPEPNADASDGPFATITKARDAIRALKDSARLPASVAVWIRGGRYALAAPLVFGPEDSAPVTYAAYPGETPVLDGGVRIEGWRKTTVNGRTAWTTTVEEVAAGRWYFRSLFVNGERRRRPRLPKEGFYRVKDYPGSGGDAWTNVFAGSNTFQCEPGHVSNWKNLGDVEIIAFHWWIEERMPVASFDEATNTVTSTRTSRMQLRDDVAEGYARYYVENVCEALTEPGEWYLDRTTGLLTYLPLPGEKLDEVEAYAPRLDEFLRIVGAPDENRHVEFIRFEGVTFEHAEWRQPSGLNKAAPVVGKGPVEFASSAQAAHTVPGVITFEGARNCAVEDCTVRHVGGYGVDVGEGCSGIRIVGNTITDVGAGGVKINGADAAGPVCRRTGNNRVTDNVLEHGGRVFMSAVGILSMHSFGNHLSHNHIHDFYYTGVSCGWVWGYRENVSRDNRIEKNHIHDLGHGVLSDMGGIYTLGVQPGTVLRGNLIHDVEKANYGGWALYNDEGSSHMILENNVCYDTSSACYHQHYGRENVVRNNVLAFGREGVATVTRYEDHLSGTFYRNVLISDGMAIFAGGKLEQPIYISDCNVLWDVSGEPHCANAGHDKGKWTERETFSIPEWRTLGYDLQSLAADPKCRDAGGRDFTLADDSPAFALGFKPIDLSDVGPRPKGKRE